VLTFTAIWLIEMVAKLHVHIMQYLFIGAGLCVFYLLELSLSEHLGFYLAYFIATVAIVVVISAYSLVVLHTGKRAAIVGAGLSALYLYLFTLLQEQNYSLVIGSLGLFFILAAVMYATRNIDWFKVTQIPVLKTQKAEST
jgi:inner membrane protein